MYSLQWQLGDTIKVLTLVETRAKDATDLMKDSLLLMIRSTQLNIEAGGRPTPFAPLAQSTIDARLGVSAGKFAGGFGKSAVKKQNKYFGMVSSLKILRDTGLLMQSLGAGASGIFEEADGFGEYDASSATLGTNRPGADAIQLGYPPNNLPGREYILFQVQDEDDLLVMAEDFYTGAGPYAEA